jgi:hypothetical protein
MADGTCFARAVLIEVEKTREIRLRAAEMTVSLFGGNWNGRTLETSLRSSQGYLKLSLVSCPIALFPATSEREKISFLQVNKNTGHRIKYREVDAESGDEVDSADIIKGYEIGKGDYIELAPEELDAVAIESKRVFDIDEFVPRAESTPQLKR